MSFVRALSDLRALSARMPLHGWIEDLERLLAPEACEIDFARWLGHAAHRWLAMHADLVMMASLAQTADRAESPSAAGHSVDPRPPDQRPPDQRPPDQRTALLLPWLHDATLFDDRIFDVYLGCVAPVAVVDMCPEVRQWAGSPMRSLVCTGDVVEQSVRYLDEHTGEAFLIVQQPWQPTLSGLRVLGRPLLVPGGLHITAVTTLALRHGRLEPHHLASPEAWLGWLGRFLADPGGNPEMAA